MTVSDRDIRLLERSEFDSEFDSEMRSKLRNEDKIFLSGIDHSDEQNCPPKV
jgi:hypothetical protein